jgi:hypothetical protein
MANFKLWVFEPMNRFLVALISLHPGQVATAWVGCIFLAGFMLWQRSGVTASIGTRERALREYVSAPKTFMDSYTPEQRAQAEASDLTLISEAKARTKRLRLLRFGVDAVVFLAISAPLLLSWVWFGARTSPPSQLPPGDSRRLAAAWRWLTVPHTVKLVLLLLGGLMAFVLGEAVVLWFRR